MGKRLYYDRAVYMITTNTKRRFPFFEEDIFSNIFLDVLAGYQKMKSYNVLGYKVNPDHIHIVLQPTGTYNISQIMQSVKRVSSNQINQVVTFENQDSKFSKLTWTPSLILYRRQFQRKNNFGVHEFPLFKWLPSFDDNLIRNREQLKNTLLYLKKQSEKHALSENKFLMIAKKIPDNIFFLDEFIAAKNKKIR